jgi:dTDP-glucose 4,6-dehydratase
LEENELPFTEKSLYSPNNPYAASKAAADHMVRAFHRTYGLPTLITNCSNNYGPHQFPEKLIPLVIHHALSGKPIPIYGTGVNVRDWIYVTDHCRGIQAALDKASPGETYNLGGNCEKTNLALAEKLCAILDQARPRRNGTSYKNQITFVPDRSGHDR